MASKSSMLLVALLVASLAFTSFANRKLKSGLEDQNTFFHHPDGGAGGGVGGGAGGGAGGGGGLVGGGAAGCGFGGGASAGLGGGDGGIVCCDCREVGGGA